MIIAILTIRLKLTFKKMWPGPMGEVYIKIV